MTAAIPRYGASRPLRIEFRRGNARPAAGSPFPWQEIAAAGVGYMRSPARGRAVPTKQGQALEIYPQGYPFEQRHPRLSMFRVTEAPPRQGLPEVRHRILLPSFGGAANQAEQGVRAYAPQLWLGHYQRAWRRIPGR